MVIWFYNVPGTPRSNTNSHTVSLHNVLPRSPGAVYRSLGQRQGHGNRSDPPQQLGQGGRFGIVLRGDGVQAPRFIRRERLVVVQPLLDAEQEVDRKSTRLNSSH